MTQQIIKHGSEAHALFLGLRKSEPGDIPTFDGWTLVDPTQWGPNARPEFLEAQLKQKVNEWRTPPTVPANAPTLWTPTPGAPPTAPE